MDAIKIEGLMKKYGSLIAVNGVSLDIEKGEIFGMLGPNGAGKTTILMMLSTLLKPTLGTAKVNNFDIVTEQDEVRGSIGMVFQDPSSDILLTGYENLKLHALMYNVPVKEIDKRIENVLNLVDLYKRKDDIVKHYSGGMRRRMEIARGLLHEPGILFLDEPTLGLDPQTRAHIWGYIESLSKKTDMTIVLTTHYMEEAEKLCDRIAIIDHGKIVALDTPKDLIASVGGDLVSLKGTNINLDKIKMFSFVREVKELDGSVQLSVEDSGKNLQEILVSAGKIESVEVHSPDLNDVFMHYTGREMRDSSDIVEYIQDISRAS